MILFWVFGQEMKYGEVVRKNRWLDFEMHSHDSWGIGQVFWGSLDGNTLKTCIGTFVGGWQDCRGIGLRIGGVEPKMSKLENYRSFPFLKMNFGQVLCGLRVNQIWS